MLILATKESRGREVALKFWLVVKHKEPQLKWIHKALPLWSLKIIKIKSLTLWGVSLLPIKDQGTFTITYNKVDLAKWLRYFHHEPNTLWHKVIVSKYGLSPFKWTLNGVSGTSRSPWRGIVGELLFTSQFCLLLGWDGRDTFFLGRLVIGDSHLYLCFPHLYHYLRWKFLSGWRSSSANPHIVVPLFFCLKEIHGYCFSLFFVGEVYQLFLG